MNADTNNAPAAEDGRDHGAVAAAASDTIVIAIHGIGDQYQNATIQTVVSAFGKFFDYPAATPLGRFSSEDRKINRFTLPLPPPGAQPLPPELANIGFFEIYWADLPRKVRRIGYVIEESKAWARTVVERVRARYGVVAQRADEAPALNHDDFLAAADVLEEMIETIAVLGNLLAIGKKAGVLSFDLDALLPAYIGTVQLVGDFPYYREQILERFEKQFKFIAEQYEGRVEEAVKNNEKAPEPPDIYVIAHSEGTVVALMGLLKAMCVPPVEPLVAGKKFTYPSAWKNPPAWVHWIRGLMTFGSPIDKHLVLWPDIWDKVQEPHQNLGGAGRPKIQWRNYYDFGDPVGFDLDTARDWLGKHGWRPFIDFYGKEDQRPDQNGRNDDYGFARYVLPGAAHTGYWDDDAVFGHFLQTVMHLTPVTPAADACRSYTCPPASRRGVPLASNVIPYILSLALLYLGVFLLRQGVDVFVKEPPVSLRTVVSDVAGMTLLIAGTTVAARLPRLTRAGAWEWVSWGSFIVGAAAYAVLVDLDARRRIGFLPKGSALETQLSVHSFWPGTLPTLITIALALGVTWIARFAGRRRRTQRSVRPFLEWLLSGAKPLMLPGGAAVLAVVVCRIAGPQQHEKTGALWPLLLAGAAFLYLWWLAVLLFDLVFVWHRYIRHAVADQRLQAFRRHRKESDPKDP